MNATRHTRSLLEMASTLIDEDHPEAASRLIEELLKSIDAGEMSVTFHGQKEPTK